MSTRAQRGPLLSSVVMVLLATAATGLLVIIGFQGLPDGIVPSTSRSDSHQSRNVDVTGSPSEPGRAPDRTPSPTPTAAPTSDRPDAPSTGRSGGSAGRTTVGTSRGGTSTGGTSTAPAAPKTTAPTTKTTSPSPTRTATSAPSPTRTVSPSPSPSPTCTTTNGRKPKCPKSPGPNARPTASSPAPPTYRKADGDETPRMSSTSARKARRAAGR